MPSNCLWYLGIECRERFILITFWGLLCVHNPVRMELYALQKWVQNLARVDGHPSPTQQLYLFILQVTHTTTGLRFSLRQLCSSFRRVLLDSGYIASPAACNNLCFLYYPYSWQMHFLLGYLSPADRQPMSRQLVKWYSLTYTPELCCMLVKLKNVRVFFSTYAIIYVYYEPWSFRTPFKAISSWTCDHEIKDFEVRCRWHVRPYSYVFFRRFQSS